jgi:glycopeptide antibiotics resistance protein
MRALAGIFLSAWIVGGLVLTLQAAHPLAGQVVTDNLVPLHTVAIYLDRIGSPFWTMQIVGNLGLLLPVGLLGPVVLPPLRRWWLVLLLAIAISAAIEVAQLWVPYRSSDIDDVVMNVTGALLGFALYRLVGRVVQAPVR